MLILETIAKIRRAFFVQGKSIKLICRELRVSRKVVRKVIRSEGTEFRYEREAQPLPKIGPWTDQLDELLLANEGKAARERLTLIRLFEELRGRGYGGGYDAVRRYAGRWSKERGHLTAAAYVPLTFEPGEAYQFDWSHEIVLLNGVTVIVKAAHEPRPGAPAVANGKAAGAAQAAEEAHRGCGAATPASTEWAEPGVVLRLRV